MFRRGCWTSSSRASAQIGASHLAFRASMEPRRFCVEDAPRGGPVRASDTRSNGTATFSSRMRRSLIRTCRLTQCFNGAVTFPSRMPARARALHEQHVQASMGPRRFRRGCSIPNVIQFSMLEASMGPRRFRRGCNAAVLACARPWRLQWGRDVSVADARACRARARPFHVLQWGRDVSVADAMDQVGKTKTTFSLQWGREVSVADALTSALPTAPGAKVLQWGRDVSVADASIRRRWVPSRRRFNGAATFPSRMHYIIIFFVWTPT
jgi:hypothetical protein